MNGVQPISQKVRETVMSYEDAVKGIATVLKRRHKLTASEADDAIRMSPFKTVFAEDPEMATHTSNEAWAREIYTYWKKSNQKN